MAAVVPAGDEGPDPLAQPEHRGDVGPVQGLALVDPELDLDEVQPGRRGEGEVHLEYDIGGQPGLHFGGLVHRVVIHHQMQLLVGVSPGDLLPERHELLAPVPRLARGCGKTGGHL